MLAWSHYRHSVIPLQGLICDTQHNKTVILRVSRFIFCFAKCYLLNVIWLSIVAPFKSTIKCIVLYDENILKQNFCYIFRKLALYLEQ